MRYAMLIAGDDREWSALSEADEQDVMKQVYEWFERWQPTGRIADGGIELQPRETARTVRAGIPTERVMLCLLSRASAAPPRRRPSW